MKKFWWIGLSIIFLVSLTTLSARSVTINLEKTQKTMPVKKAAAPVILDARPPFEYAMGHIPQSANIRWKDYSQTDPAHLGALDPDFDLLARKLRISGVAPDVQVMVVGAGPKGDGSEGRIAWMLSFLGIEKISVQNYDNLPGKKTVEEGLPHENAPIWLPQTVDSLKISKRDLEYQLSKVDGVITLIDVREDSEFLGKPGAHKGHIKGAINISWKEFFGKTGDVLSSDNVVGVFKAHHVDVAKTLVFYSNYGVRSGLVTFLAWQAKLAARNYDGSLTEWSTDPKAELE